MTQTRGSAQQFRCAFILHLHNLVADGKTVQLSGFGTFEPYTSKPTKKRAFETKEVYEVPSKTRVRFKLGVTFKDLVAASKE